MAPRNDSCLQLAELVGIPAASSGSNFVFSPLSIRAALSLAAVGSKGSTLDQFLSFLGSPTVADLNSAAAQLLGSVRSTRSDGGDDSGSRLSFVNGVWVDQSLTMKPSFQEIAASVYGAVAKSVDFQREAPEAARQANDFVENATHGLINDLIPSDSVDEHTMFILANALYFKGMWAEKFDVAKTTNKDFHLLDSSTTQVPFMTSTKDQFLASFDGFKVLRLPYQQDGERRSFSMLLFLPDKRDGLISLLKRATSERNFFGRHIPSRQVPVGEFMIPKFRISSKFEATADLASLGLVLPFDSVNAEFCDMVLESTSNRLFVSSLHHKATIEVEEEGTVAAAATGVVMTLLCYTRPVNFVADHVCYCGGLDWCCFVLWACGQSRIAGRKLCLSFK